MDSPGCPSASCSPISPPASTIWPWSAPWSRGFHSIPGATSCSTPAGTWEGIPAWDPGSPTLWAARTRTCPDMCCCTPEIFPPAAWRIFPTASCPPPTRPCPSRPRAMPSTTWWLPTTRGCSRPSWTCSWTRTGPSALRRAATTPWRRPSATTKWPTACSRWCRTFWTWTRRPRPPSVSTAWTPPTRTSGTTACSVCGPAGWWRKGCASWRSPARFYSGRTTGPGISTPI